MIQVKLVYLKQNYKPDNQVQCRGIQIAQKITNLNQVYKNKVYICMTKY